MKRNILGKLALVSALSLAALGSPALAQRGQKNGNGGAGQSGFGGFPNMSGMMKMLGRNRMIEPRMSNIMILLSRNDVRAELGLSAKQKEDLDGQQEKTLQSMMTTIFSKVQERMGDFQGLKDLSEADRKEKMQTFQNEMRGTVETVVNDSNKDLEKVLTKKQMTRLKQLDLQWRGTLAVADPTVAEPLKITAEQKQEVEKISSEYREKQQTQMSGAFGGFGGPGGAGGQAPPPDLSAIQDRMAQMQKEGNKLREDYGKKVLALLTDTQKSEWEKMQGVKFKFRANDD